MAPAVEEDAIAGVVREFVESFGEPTASTRWSSFLTGKVRRYADLVTSEPPPSGLDEDTRCPRRPSRRRTG
jgi:hypothetical protein